ncbi:glycine cleavage system aminomethyltransferase GcvT [Variovorax guangxiensis]|uniref:aminomethyltransferase n=1 Tax=Variovorax guangxiensis TaxID=1775474 RepID=A0A502E0R1_9BURK|nr:glycine cleavage system aminomethyltransferase GcvT [Variovorax guangxiensis]TPG27206.1 glycine cleavage system aminomethyltransferase GcvT [Variovorax ginsengisoli]TPG30934.1 glycine cleavage system aminomethyltransferase GcvT [Variovorax guangxiensis]
MVASDDSLPLQKTPLHALHVELGARMVPFAGYAMPVQYPAGLMAEHKHTRTAAGLFDISHMGQLRLVGPNAAAALETLMPVDVVDLAPGKQRYGLLLNDAGGILDDLMFFNEGHGSLFVIVNGACKAADLAHIQQKIGARCDVQPMPDHALLALQGPQAAATLARLSPGVERFVFMTGGAVQIGGIPAFVTRSGYTGEDGFEISVKATDADALARMLLAEPEVQPIGLGARNSLRLEAGLCLYGNDIDETTTPVEASLNWAIQKVRRTGGARAGGFPGADRVLAQLAAVASGTTGIADHDTLKRRRVGLVALERIPVRDGTPLQSFEGMAIGQVTSGLLGPTVDRPVAMGYVAAAYAEPGTRIQAMVRGKLVPMEVCTLPFLPARYHRG